MVAPLEAERKCPHCAGIYFVNLNLTLATRFPTNCPVCNLPQPMPGSIN